MEKTKPMVPLKIEIRNGSKTVREVLLADPRRRYIAEFNRRCEARGLTARAG